MGQPVNIKSNNSPEAAIASLVILADPTEARIRTPFTATSTIELSPGISYTKGTMRTGWRNHIQSVRVATVTPAHPSVRLRSLLSNDLVVGRGGYQR